jgi:hypothetical protein
VRARAVTALLSMSVNPRNYSAACLREAPGASECSAITQATGTPSVSSLEKRFG